MSHRVALTARASARKARSSPFATVNDVIGCRTTPSAVGASPCTDPSTSAPPIARRHSTGFPRPPHLYSRGSSRWLGSPGAAAGSSCNLRTSRAHSRGISSTPHFLDDASAEPAKADAEPKSDDAKTDDAPPAVAEEEDDPCPPWQNPLHHNNPDYNGKVFKEDFAEGEEMPVVPLPPFEAEGEEGKVLAPPHIHELADEIVRLSMLEVKELVDRIGDHFGFEDDDGYVDEDGGGGGGGGGGGEEAKAEEEKTAFELKLVGFDAKGKIKVIKEVRGMAGLGLKEAKELVEGAPTVIMKDIKKEEAEELKAKLEAVGAQVEIV